MKLITSIFTLFISVTCFGHQPDLSTSVLSTTKSGKHVLQITSALVAFEGEIDYIYTKEAYATPEEFKQLVVNHFENNIHFIVNLKDTLKFAQPLIVLGHETKVIVEILNLPKEVNSIEFKNSMFKDMPHNRMAFIMIVENLPKEQYVLDNENNQTVILDLLEGIWKIKSTNQSDFFIYPVSKLNIVVFSLATLIIIISTFLYRRLNKSQIFN